MSENNSSGIKESFLDKKQNSDKKTLSIRVEFFNAWIVRTVLALGLYILAKIIFLVVLGIAIKNGLAIEPIKKMMFIVGFPGYFVVSYYLYKWTISEYIIPQLNIDLKIKFDFLKAYLIEGLLIVVCTIIISLVKGVWLGIMVMRGANAADSSIIVNIVVISCSLFVQFACYKWSINKFII